MSDKAITNRAPMPSGASLGVKAPYPSLQPVDEAYRARRRETIRKALRKRRETLKALGRCVDCGLKKGPDDHGTLCGLCKDDRAIRARKQKNRPVERLLKISTHLTHLERCNHANNS